VVLGTGLDRFGVAGDGVVVAILAKRVVALCSQAGGSGVLLLLLSHGLAITAHRALPSWILLQRAFPIAFAGCSAVTARRQQRKGPELV
jgi:hypothetical protein